MARADFFRMSSGMTERGARISIIDSLSHAPGRNRNACTTTKMEAIEIDSMSLAQPRTFIRAAAIEKALEVGHDEISDRPGAVTALVALQLSELRSDLGGFDAFR